MKLLILLFLVVGCATKPLPVVNNESVKPGSSVNFMGNKVKLYKGSLKVGDKFSHKTNRTGINFKFQNKVTIVNIVPSIDTPVCEAQTHILGEDKTINKGIDLVTISRDLPMAQSRFAKEAKLTNINYYSDYKYGKFGKKTGLLLKDKELLARGVLVLDEKGIVRYIQIVSEITQIPDMNKAIQFANSLVK
tara:strand:+ start:252602 stop:253174 length:573 start_codon:yes stop_codon:yes gene_type:complete